VIPFLVAAALAAYNNLVNRWAPFHRWAYVPLNLVVTAVLLALALGPLGLATADVGLGRDLGRGAALGAASGLVLAIPVALLLRSEAGTEVLADARLRGSGPREIVYRALVRVPLGTAVPEEIAFRGVLFALWEPHGPVVAAVASSLAFAVWHVVPALNRLLANHPQASPGERLRAVAAAVAFTSAAGVFLVGLRLVAGNLAAPLLLHAVLNAACTAAAFAAHRRLVMR
jgi:membrane protease YdiL (CAAX protease family)